MIPSILSVQQPQTQTRSRFGTLLPVYLDWSNFSVKSGWDSVESFGKRVCGLAAFVLVSASLFPIWTPGQSRLEYQLNENTRQLQQLSTVPTDIAIIKEKIAGMESRIKDDGDNITQIKNTAFTASAGMLCWMAIQLFQFFGGNAKRKQGGQP